MKKVSKKWVSLVLALITVVSSGMMEFVSHGVEEQIGYKGYDVYYDFESTSLADLEKAGVTSTLFNGTTQVSAETGVTDLSKHWTNDGTGLKRIQHDSGDRARMDFAVESDNFEIVAEVYLYQNQGIIFGEETVWPSYDSSSTGVYFSGGNYMWVEGVNQTTVKRTGAKVTAPQAAGTGYISWGSSDWTTGSAELMKLHVRVIGKDVTIWEEGSGAVTTVRLHDNHKLGKIGFMAKYEANAKGFKSVAINQYDVGYDFVNADMTALDEAGLKSIQMDGKYKVVNATEESVSKHWTSGADGIYATGAKKNYPAILSVGQERAAFEMVVQMQGLSYDTGVKFGTRTKHPEAESYTGESTVLFTSGAAYSMWVEGINSSTLSVTAGGHCTETSTGYTLARIDNIPTTTMMTLHVKVVDGTMQFWYEEYDHVVFQVKIAANHVMDMLSVMSVGSSSVIRNVSIDYTPTIRSTNIVDFKDADTATLTDFTSTLLLENEDGYSVIEGEANQAVSKHWFTGTNSNYGYGSYTDPHTNEETSGIEWAYRWWGIKPQHTTSKKYGFLTYKGEHDDFEVSYTIREHYNRYGLIFGRELEYPTSINDGSVRIYIQALTDQTTGVTKNWLTIVGAIDVNSAVATDTERELKKSVGYVQYDVEDLYLQESDKEYPACTTNVRVLDGKVTVWLGDSNVSLTVNMAGSYESGKVSLFANSCSSGAFVNFALKDIVGSEIRESSIVGYTMQAKGDYAVMTLTTDTAYSKVIGNVSYNTELYDYAGALFLGDAVDANQGREFEATNGVVNIDMLVNNAGEVVTLLFKEKQDTNDFRDFEINQTGVTVSGGDVVATVNETLTLDKDYHLDDIIDILDLVAAKKLTTDDSATVREVLVGLNKIEEF